MLEAALQRLANGESLSMDEMSAAIEAIMLGQCGEAEIAELLLGLRAKGETVAEVAGAASAMRRHMTPIRTRRTGVIDTCGTGGDGSSTFNISTAAALVTAAAGVPVAKHGNRGMSSRSGSADVLAALGVNIEAGVACVEACLDELGICFCFAPLLHQSMKHVAPVRRKLGVPTIFNLLGPLVNPAGAPFQLLGVGRPERRPLLAEALAMLDTRRAVVVCGEDGLDEVTLSGPTRVTEVVGKTLREFAWTPTDFGLEPAGLDQLIVAGPEESAAIIRRVLAGETGPARDIVVLNAAAALWTAGKAETLPACAALAQEAIDRQQARELLATLAQRSHA
ncbi:MAG: anthranilate phosphoribosyltransferase [Pirellulales bacterium]